MKKSVPFILLMIVAVVIATATIIEDVCGTAMAHHLIYGALWFKLLWLLVVGAGIRLICKERLWRRPAICGLHVSFLVILTGALVTSFTSQSGMLHLRQGIPEKDFLTQEGFVRQLPFYVRLDNFKIQYYPGTQAPQNYISQVTVEDQQLTISMNHIARKGGYRLYQSSYDPDGGGSILSVTYDPWGTGITYTGYALLALSILLSLPRRIKWAGILLALAFPVQAKELPSIRREKADSIEREQILWNNRVTPVGTMAQEFLLKVYGSRTYHGLTATQVVCSMTLEPVRWSAEPLIKVRRGTYKSLDDFTDSKGCLKGMGVDSKVDEKVALVVMLMRGNLFTDVPEGAPRLSDTRISAELFYNHTDWLLCGMILCTIILVTVLLTRRERFHTYIPLQYIVRAGTLILLIVGFGLRWYIAGHIPLSNGYETLWFMAMVLILANRWGCVPAFFLLLVAHLGSMNPQITPLMPVLHSPWLSAHVSIIMMSYALLALSIIQRRFLLWAVYLLAIGIFLGAIWANVSWGTYWSWDPKESWALVTLIVYSLPLHANSMPWFRSQRNYRLYSLVALACLLMTYFGVNYLLGGMHSYANT